MPLFVGVHKILPGTTEDQLKNSWEGYKATCQKMGLRPMAVMYNLLKGAAYCQTEANSESQVREAHQGVTLPLEDIFEVKTLS